MSAARAADYGLDAPRVVRNLFIIGALALLLWASRATGVWSGLLRIPIGKSSLNIDLAGPGIWIAPWLFFTGLWMVWSSKVGKLRDRDALLNRISWLGSEQVLDVGCGRGLMLVGAAKRLTTGKATGIDIWQAEDLSSNRPDAALENAKSEGVEARVETRTADMREMPFPDASFDVIVSRAAIHNLYSADDRATAIREIARVLRPGGHALIEDIRHGREYAAAFARDGCTDVRHVGSRASAVLATILTMGSIRPTTLVVRKDSP